MADSSVLLEVIVEGKNIKIVQREIEELGGSINRASAAEEKNNKSKKKSDKQNKKNKDSLKSLNDEQNHFNRGQKGVAGATANGTKAFSKQRDLLGGSSGLVGAYATLAANIFAATALFGALQRASQLQKLEEGLLALGAASGLALKSLSKGLVESTDSAVSLEQAMRTVATATSAGIDPSQLERFGKAAKDASNALGRDLSDTLDRVIRGVTKLEPELLDEIGVFVRLDDAVEKYASSIGKSASELTEFERRLAFQNETLGQLESKFGSLGDSVDSNPYNKLAAALNDLVKSAGEFLAIFDPVVKLLASSPIALIGTLTFLARGVLQQAAGAMFTFGINTEKAILATRKLGRGLSKEIPMLGSKAKALQNVSLELRKGVINTNSINKVIAQQNSIVAGLTKRYDNGKISLEALNAAKTRAVTITNKLNVAVASLRMQQALANVNLVLAALQQGRFNLALKLTKRSLGQAAAGIALYTASLKGLSFAAVIARLAITGLSLSIKLLGLALFVVVPYLAAIGAALALLYEGYKFIADSMRTEEEKAYREQVTKTNDTLNELKGSLKELEKYNNGQISKIGSLAQKYESLGNAVTTAVSSLQDLKAAALATGDQGAFREFVSRQSKFINENESLARKFRERNSGKTIFQAAPDIKDRAIIGEQFLQQIQKETEGQRALSSAVTETTRVLQEFRTANKVSNEFTNLADSLKVFNSSLQTAVNLDGVENQADATRLALEKFSDSDLKEFGIPPRSIENFKLFTAEIDATRSTIGKLIAKRAGLAKGDHQERSKLTKDIKLLNGRIEARQADLLVIGKIASALVDNRTEEVKNAESAMSSQMQIIEVQKLYLNTLKASSNTTESSIRGIIDAENSLLLIQQQKNDLLITELKSRAGSYTEAQRDEEIADTLRIVQLTQENLELEANKTTELKAQVKIKQGALTNLQLEQNYLKAASAELQKQTNALNTINNIRLELSKNKLSLLRAEAGQGLTAEDELKLAQDAENVKKQAAFEAFKFKVAEINMEYDLLEAKYALMRAEINAAVEIGNLTEKQGAKALNALDNVNLTKGRALSIAAAGAQYVKTFTEAENQVALARIKVDRERTARQIEELNNQATIARQSGNESKALELEQSALAKQRAQYEADIAFLKSKGLSQAEAELALAKQVSAEVANRQSMRAERTQTATELQGSFGGAAFGAVETVGNSQEQGGILAEGSDSGIGEKIGVYREALSGMIEQMRALGPEGEVIGLAVQGALVMGEAWGNVATTFQAGGSAMEKGAAVASAVASTFQAIGSIMNAQSNAQISAIDKQIAAEKKRDGKSKESLAKLKQLEKKKEAIQKKQFETQKKIQMATIIASTAAAVMQTLAASGVGFFATPLAMLVAAMGAAQLAIVAGTSYQGGSSSSSESSIPSQVSIGERKSTVDLAKSQSATGEQAYLRGERGIGGPEAFTPAFMGAKYRAMGGATTGYVVGEQGPELFVPDRPGTVVPADQTAQVNSAPTNVNFTINAVDAAGVDEVISRQRGTIIGVIREAANSYGDLFLEDVDTNVYSSSYDSQRTYRGDQ